LAQHTAFTHVPVLISSHHAHCFPLQTDSQPEADSPPANADAAAKSPPSRGNLRPPLPAELQAALKNLAALQPVDPIAGLNSIRAAAVHSKDSLEPQVTLCMLCRLRMLRSTHISRTGRLHRHSPSLTALLAPDHNAATPCLCPLPLAPQLGFLVPLVLRAVRVPCLGTACAGILTFQDLFLSYGDAMYAPATEDSSPSSCVLLALLRKATGADLNSRRIAGDANACLL
jgi:hypothetical protein